MGGMRFGWAAMLSALAIATLQIGAAVAKNPVETPERFVQAFYDWYAASYDKYDPRGSRPPPDIAAIRQRPALFDKTLAEMIVADWRASAKCEGYIVGLDYDPFLEVQDTGGRFKVTGAEKIAAGYRVSVSLDGKPHVLADIGGGPGHWRFTDFSDPDGRRLSKVLADLAKDERACPKD